MTQNRPVWIFQNDLHVDDLVQIFKLLRKEYSVLFGLETLEAEPCIIFNAPYEDTPMLVINTTPIRIRLAQENLSYWAQTIFQLSHELCHYVIRQYKTNKDFTLSWFEELVCEAMSLYALELSVKNWSECELSIRAPSFSFAIEKYLNAELSRIGSNEFSSCNTPERLAYYEQELNYLRESRRNERNLLYRAISNHPDNVKILCHYMEYLNPDDLTIDFDRWIKDTPSALLDVCKEIYPIKVKE